MPGPWLLSEGFVAVGLLCWIGFLKARCFIFEFRQPAGASDLLVLRLRLGLKARVLLWAIGIKSSFSEKNC